MGIECNREVMPEYAQMVTQPVVLFWLAGRRKSLQMSRSIVILVNYRGAEDTANCLRSLYASDVVPLVVLVDNTPNDPDLPNAITQYPDVHLISAPENLGFGGGNNLGIQWAMSETNCEFLSYF